MKKGCSAYASKEQNAKCKMPAYNDSGDESKDVINAPFFPFVLGVGQLLLVLKPFF